MKKIFFLLFALLFGTGLKGQPTDTLPTSEKIFSFNPVTISAMPFWARFHAKEQFSVWSATDWGGRVMLTPQKPNFLFAYCDFYKEQYREENFENSGPPLVFEENLFLIEAGLGMSGSLHLPWGLSLDGQVSIPLTHKPIPTLGFGPSWGINNFFLGFQNLVTCDQPGLWNPCVYVGYTQSIEFRRKRSP